jgi:hypothetical protein
VNPFAYICRNVLVGPEVLAANDRLVQLNWLCGDREALQPHPRRSPVARSSRRRSRPPASTTTGTKRAAPSSRFVPNSIALAFEEARSAPERRHPSTIWTACAMNVGLISGVDPAAASGQS